MKELQQRQRVKKWLYSLPALIALLVIAGFMARGAYGIAGKLSDSTEKVRELREEAAALSLRSAELSENIALLGTDEGKIKEIREKFTVTEEGEHVAIIVDSPAGPEESEKGIETEKREWWNWLKSLFGR